MIEWWRRALVGAIRVALAVALFAAGELTGLFRAIIPSGFFSDPWIHFFAMFVLAAFLANGVKKTVAGRVFRSYYRAWRLASHGAYSEAVEAYREQIDFLARNPWVDQFRTLLLLDEYAESFSERMWTYLAGLYWQRGDLEQMVVCYEKSLEVKPNSFAGLYALSIIDARTGGKARSFKIPRQQLRFGRGWAVVLMWLGWIVLSTVFANLFFLMDDTGLVGPILWQVVWTGCLLLLFFDVPMSVAGRLINQIVQWGYHSAYRMAVAGELEEAARALELDARYWRNNPGLQKLQWLFLDATPRSYLERTLRLLAMVSLRLGKPAEFARAYRECLDINPESNVRYWLNLYEGSSPAGRPLVEPEAAS